MKYILNVLSLLPCNPGKHTAAPLLGINNNLFKQCKMWQILLNYQINYGLKSMRKSDSNEVSGADDAMRKAQRKNSILPN